MHDLSGLIINVAADKVTVHTPSTANAIAEQVFGDVISSSIFVKETLTNIWYQHDFARFVLIFT
jgi:hypothetical protein